MALRLVALTAAFVLACSTVSLAADQMLQFPLYAQNHSGEEGFVTIIQHGPDLAIGVTAINADLSLKQPIHIHKNTCATLDPKPTYPLATIQNGESATLIRNVSIAQLQATDFAINIHHSTSDVATYWASGTSPKRCNELRPSRREKRRDDRVELGRLFDLRPMPAAPEHVQLCVGQQAQ